MDILGARVQSETFGSGVVTEQSETMVAVDFGGAVKKFLYPSCFETFLTAEDPAIHSGIVLEREARQQQRAERRRMMLLAERQRAAKKAGTMK